MCQMHVTSCYDRSMTTLLCISALVNVACCGLENLQLMKSNLTSREDSTSHRAMARQPCQGCQGQGRTVLRWLFGLVLADLAAPSGSSPSEEQFSSNLLATLLLTCGVLCLRCHGGHAACAEEY